ncbi:short-chain dehydrogenase [Subtercola sp. Z020]|uniref:SDR family NAD(P)-dependent oxidoreductase n=1 Tax=Subtercola sp. Z020 TaxID=2080582 RepID=UPI000CE8501F|nr:SDR family NAD(P)-dependent oxidoreductase [Subtercola sp. Z020]PPF78847.1 short-chain dehydrogenase [Subtercola sp. Z020]
MPQRTVVITGASDGIGRAAARTLKQRGDDIVIVGRSEAKTKAVADELAVPYYLADYSRLSDVRTLATRLLENHPRIDVLANNAGGLLSAREETEDGFEKTLQVNHLAPFLLTNLLLDRLQHSKGVVINTASIANSLYGKIDIDDLNLTKKYTPNHAYGNGKLANILFTRELQKRYGSSGIEAAAFHPGIVRTSFAAGSSSNLRFVYRTVLGRLMMSPEKGSDTLVWLATTEPGVDWVPGEYYERRRIQKATKQAYDEALASRLWEASASMVGLD